MKILKKDLKNSELKLLVETHDDLWHLERILEPGDFVTSRTFRKTVVKSGSEFREGERKPVVLTIKLEKTEFQRDSGILRLAGPIHDGPEDVPRGSYHTIQADVGSTLSIVKPWKKYHIERLERARLAKQPVIICMIDRESCDFAVLRESGVEMRAGITNRNREDMGEYYGKIRSYLEASGFGVVVIAGPGFERENLRRYLKGVKSPVASKAVVEHASSTGINGVNEVIKKSGNRLLRESRLGSETEKIQEFLKRVRMEGLVVYGENETKKAVEMGAVENLLVSENKLREMESLMEMQERMGGSVSVISSDYELGEQFLHLGGVGGFLRFRMEY